MKSKMTLLDLRAAIADVQSILVGRRIDNIYDINNRTYTLKFSGDYEGGKLFLLVESGTRIHLTKFAREKNIAPSGFTMKLRKHMKGKRLESIALLGTDRLVDLHVGWGDNTFHLFLELYSAGNIILTDGGYNILHLIRRYESSQGVQVSIGNRYPVDSVRVLERISEQALNNALMGIQSETSSNGKQESQTGGRRGKGRLFTSLASLLNIGSDLLEHSIFKSELTLNDDPNSVLKNEEALEMLFTSIKEAEDLLDNQKPFDRIGSGYIVLKRTSTLANVDGTPISEDTYNNLQLFDAANFLEFIPILLKQHEKALQERRILSFKTFNEAIDFFFSKKEESKAEKARKGKLKNLEKKAEKVKESTKKKMEALEDIEMKTELKAKVIQENNMFVEEVMNFVRSFIAGGVDWKIISHIVEDERVKGNKVALSIEKLNFKENMISILLPCGAFSEDEVVESGLQTGDTDFRELMVPENDIDVKSFFSEDGETEVSYVSETCVLVDLDLDLTVFMNAQRYFDARRKAKTKQKKTEVAMDSKAKKALEKEYIKGTLHKPAVAAMRKRFWFEKFNWFISSENFLVISGKDLQQNEFIFRKHMEKNDIYVHADVHGATSTVIKNFRNQEIPHSTIQQACTFSASQSSAWKDGIVPKVWWVRPEQVSKTAPSGDSVATGSFVIRGKKNYVSVSNIVMGYGLLFKVRKEDYERNHKNERNYLQEEVERKESAIANVNAEEKNEVINNEEGNSVVKKGVDEGDIDGNSQKELQIPHKKRLKYRDQDDEEKGIRLQLQGDGDVPKSSKVADETSIDDTAGKRCYNCGKTGHIRNDCPEKIQMDDQETLDVGGGAEQSAILNLFTSSPCDDDEIQYVKAISAPYTSIANFRYKCKLIHGNLKKGKASRQIMHSFISQATGEREKEKNAMLLLSESDIVFNMIGNIKIVAGVGKNANKGSGRGKKQRNKK